MLPKPNLHFFFPQRHWIRYLFYACILTLINLCYASRNRLLLLASMLTNSKTIREMDNEPQKFTCIWSVVDRREKCKPRCGHGYFGLYGMEKCHPWLTCKEIDQLKMEGGIGSHGFVKEVLLSHWKTFPVVVKKLRNVKNDLSPIIAKDGYFRGIYLMKNFFQPSVLLQLVGHCNDVIVTEVHPLLDARDVKERLKEYPAYNTLSTRMHLCINYVDILKVLHSGRDGKIYVQCDASFLNKLTQQFLITEDFRLVLSDLDSIETILLNGTNKQLIKCTDWGELHGDFLAPEQLWPYEEEFQADKMPLYDEKIEIWKIPDVCLFFLGDEPSALPAIQSLKDIHKRCKNHDPRKRPSADDVLQVYIRVLRDVVKSKMNVTLYSS